MLSGKPESAGSSFSKTFLATTGVHYTNQTANSEAYCFFSFTLVRSLNLLAKSRTITHILGVLAKDSSQVFHENARFLSNIPRAFTRGWQIVGNAKTTK